MLMANASEETKVKSGIFWENLSRSVTACWLLSSMVCLQKDVRSPSGKTDGKVTENLKDSEALVDVRALWRTYRKFSRKLLSV